MTHHTEEIPTGFTHALLLADGRKVVAGPIAWALTADHLSACFGIPLHLEDAAVGGSAGRSR